MLFTTIRKILARAKAYARVLERLEEIEEKLAPLVATATENEALWSYLDQKDEELLQSEGFCRPATAIYQGDTPEEMVAQISDHLLKAMKTQGDA
tara:strand:- start:43 stop:327 length:285 start_codon:yes stop_codon:yes gene_type:complete